MSDRRGHDLPADLINEDSWFSFLMRAIASELQSSNIFTGVNFLTGLNEGFHVLLNFLPRYVDSPLTYAIAEHISLFER